MNAVMLIAALAGAFALIHSRAVASGNVMSADQVRDLARKIVDDAGFSIDPAMLVRIAAIESAFNPAAVRVEAHINDASAGLMQTLLTTAQWLAQDMGYRNYGAPVFNDLLAAEVSMYFGAAYVDYLKNTRNDLNTEEKIVRSYNGGPAGWTRSATLPYWEKYKKAKDKYG